MKSEPRGKAPCRQTIYRKQARVEASHVPRQQSQGTRAPVRRDHRARKQVLPYFTVLYPKLEIAKGPSLEIAELTEQQGTTQPLRIPATNMADPRRMTGPPWRLMLLASAMPVCIALHPPQAP